MLRVIESAPSRTGQRQWVALVRCPACGERLTDADGEPLPGRTREAHIGSHSPEDFGLSPVGSERDVPTEVSP